MASSSYTNQRRETLPYSRGLTRLAASGLYACHASTRFEDNNMGPTDALISTERSAPLLFLLLRLKQFPTGFLSHLRRLLSPPHIVGISGATNQRCETTCIVPAARCRELSIPCLRRTAPCLTMWPPFAATNRRSDTASTGAAARCWLGILLCCESALQFGSHAASPSPPAASSGATTCLR